MGIEGRGDTIPIYDEFAIDILNAINHLKKSDLIREVISNISDTYYNSLLGKHSIDYYTITHEDSFSQYYKDKYGSQLEERNIPGAYYRFKYNFKPSDVRIMNRITPYYETKLMNTNHTNKNKRSYLL